VWGDVGRAVEFPMRHSRHGKFPPGEVQSARGEEIKERFLSKIHAKRGFEHPRGYGRGTRHGTGECATHLNRWRAKTVLQNECGAGPHRQTVKTEDRVDGENRRVDVGAFSSFPRCNRDRMRDRLLNEHQHTELNDGQGGEQENRQNKHGLQRQ